MTVFLGDEADDLSKILCIRAADGRIALMIGFLVTVFFDKPWTRERREAIADLAERYVEEFRSHLRWSRNPTTARMSPIRSSRVKFPRDWLPPHEDGESWEFGFHGGESADAASPFNVEAFGSDDIVKGPGYFHASLPLLWFAEHEGTFQEFVLGICKRIKPLSGYGGVGILESPHNVIAGDFQPVVRKIAERFPGLEIENRPLHTAHVDEGIKGVNWLTILGDRWINDLGEIDALRARLDESFVFFPYEGGLIIQAGPKPQIGDVNAGRWPQHYVTLAKALKKIQIKNHYPFHFGGPGRMDHEASLAWLFRFDGDRVKSNV